MKLEMRSRKYVFVVYGEHSKSYKLYDVIKREIFWADVIFYEKTTKPKDLPKDILNVKDEVILTPLSPLLANSK